MSEITIHCLTGMPYDIGFQMARAGEAAVHGYLVATSAWADIMARRGDPRLAVMAQLVEERFPAYAQELRGLAGGLNLPFADIFAWNCRGDLLTRAPDGCTTVQIPGGAEQLIAHNEDGLPGFHGAGLMLRIEVTGAKPFAAFTYPGSLAGHTFALNESGLVQAVNNVRVDRAPGGIPRIVLGRAVLDATNIDAAIALLRDAPRSGGFHMTFAQRGNERIVSVEFAHAEISVREVRQRSVHANHLIHPGFARTAQTVTASSASRQRRGDELIESGADALSILRDEEQAELPIWRRAADDPDTENTLATALFRIGRNDVTCDVFEGRSQRPCLHVNDKAQISITALP